MDSGTTRRALVATWLSAVGLVSVGCVSRSDPEDSQPTVRKYPHLASSRLFVGSSMPLALPDSTSRTTNPEQATLVVLGQGTTVDGDQVVAWLETGVPVGVVGDPALATLANLVRAGELDDAFGADGIGAGGRRSANAAAFYPALDTQELHTFTSYGPPEDSVDRWDLEAMVEFVDTNDQGL